MINGGYEIVDTKVNEAPFDPSLKWSRNLVDYECHPAYRSLIGSSSAVLRLKAMMQFLRSMMLLVIKRIIKYEMIPVETRRPHGVGGYLTFAGVAARNALGVHSRSRTDAPPSRIFSTLDRDGCCVVRIPNDRFTELEDVARPHFERLKERRASSLSRDRDFDESRSNVDSREHGDALYGAINQILIDSGIMDAASHYLGRDARLIDVNPQINDATDSFWRRIFPDLVGMKLPDSAYFHRDASGGDLKAIFYMTDVGPQNGPFSYVVGSNKLNMSKFDDLIAEANDHNGLSATTLEARKRFAALPGKLRQKGAFGNDLPDDSRLAQEIRRGLWMITSDRGSIVLFDTKGVHRGGMVAEGERRVITNVIG